MSTSNISEAVQILDQINPEWYKHINSNRLRMYSTTDCILGQLYGHYNAGTDAIRAEGITISTELTNAFGENRVAWEQVIADKLANDAASKIIVLTTPGGKVALVTKDEEKVKEWMRISRKLGVSVMRNDMEVE